MQMYKYWNDRNDEGLLAELQQTNRSRAVDGSIFQLPPRLTPRRIGV